MPIFHSPETSSTTSPGISTRGETTSAENALGLPTWRSSESADVEMSESSPPSHHTFDRPFCPLPANDRAELIQSIKRRESPAWASHNHNWKPESKTEDHSPHSYELYQSWSREQKDEDNKAGQHEVSATDERSGLARPSEIERPRSALHSGDFREGTTQSQPQDFSDYAGFNSRPQGPPSFKRFGSSPTTPWFNPAASSRFISRGSVETSPMTGVAKSLLGARARAPSLGSFSSSYVLKAPTSPLVYQANNSDLDFSPKQEHMDISHSTKNSRRRTLPPETFMQLRNSPPNQARNFHASGSFAAAQGEDLRHQAYQPHRSSAYSLQPASSPQTPFRLQRPSFASDLSPHIHASMVGSYEESILRGRMSTTPSKPLDFTAKIGVLGRGKCKANLRCPPHITVPFPAVFYSYPTSGAGRSISDDSPSPYVGLIDLDNSLSRERSSGHKQTRDLRTSDLSGSNQSSTPIPSSDISQRHERRKTPPGGAYRIPQRGQLQIVIKNPNKTAVKLFLVPYDLDDMEPGTKTFIRQRSYSAGPIIDMPLTARKNFGTDRPEASLNPTNDPKDKPTLRYLIHLNICCPAKGRFYLYSTIRVVFANRVPDGKEKLRNEIQYPEPRYSPYKPLKDSNSAFQRSAIDKNYRRRSAGIGFTGNHFFEDRIPPPSPYPQHSPPASLDMPVQPVPFKLSVPKSRTLPTGAARSPVFSTGFWQTEKPASTQSTSEDMSLDSAPASSASPQSVDDIETHNGEELYNKLNLQKGVSGYGSGYPFSPAYSSRGESLLAQKLRDWNCSSDETRQD